MENGNENLFYDLNGYFSPRRLIIPARGTEEIWLPLDDSAAGWLKMAGKIKTHNLLDFGCMDENGFREMVDIILDLAPKRVFFAYNGFAAVSVWNYIHLLKALWEKREKVDFDLGMFVPEKVRVGANPDGSGRIVPVAITRSATAKLRDFRDLLDCEKSEMPFFDLDAPQFDLVELHEFCCKKLAYIIKQEHLFPRLDSGMTGFNTRLWQMFPDTECISLHNNVFSEYNFLHGQALRLWKLLDEKSLEKLFPCKPYSLFCRNEWDPSFFFFRIARNSDERFSGNELALAIMEEPHDSGTLFPLALFLGHYAEMGRVSCCIPEYNFHELIDALAKTIKGEPIPELLPDIPGEPEISLAAYRRGVIRLTPACRSYRSELDLVIATFKTCDAAYGFLEQIRGKTDCKFYIDRDGNVAFRDIADRNFLFTALADAATIHPEYPIHMCLLDGTTPREMTIAEILTDSAARIVRHFQGDTREAMEYLHALSVTFKDRYHRCSAVR